MVSSHCPALILRPTSPNLTRSLSSRLSPVLPRVRLRFRFRHPAGARYRATTTATSCHSSGRYPGQLSQSTLEIASLSSLYDVLEVSAAASVDEIKAAYRRLARIHHPDVAGRASSTAAGDGSDMFMKIHAAYSTLSDPERRTAYDMDLLRRRRYRVKPLRFDDGAGECDSSSSFCRLPRRNWETDQCW